MEFQGLLLTATEIKKGNTTAHQAHHIWNYRIFCQISTSFSVIFRCIIREGGGVRHNTTVWYPIYYDDDMFRPLLSIFRPQKYRVIQNDCRGTTVQRQFRTKFVKQSPSDNSIRRRYAQFQDTGCVCIRELKVRIRTAIETITADMLQTVWNELDYHVDVCRITKGAHIEHL